jgi:hypothetical protein
MYLVRLVLALPDEIKENLTLIFEKEKFGC